MATLKINLKQVSILFLILLASCRQLDVNGHRTAYYVKDGKELSRLEAANLFFGIQSTHKSSWSTEPASQFRQEDVPTYTLPRPSGDSIKFILICRNAYYIPYNGTVELSKARQNQNISKDDVIVIRDSKGCDLNNGNLTQTYNDFQTWIIQAPAVLTTVGIDFDYKDKRTVEQEFLRWLQIINAPMTSRTELNSRIKGWHGRTNDGVEWLRKHNNNDTALYTADWQVFNDQISIKGKMLRN